MKQICTALGLAFALSFGGGAHAQSFMEIEVIAGDNAVVCIGDEENTSRYGGVPVIEGKANILLPRPVMASQEVATVLVTASDGKAAGSMKINAVNPDVEASIRMSGAKAGNCLPSRLISADSIPGMIAAFGEMYQSEILEYTDGELVTRGFLQEYLSDSTKTAQGLMAEARGMQIVPDAKLAAVAAAISKIEAKERAKEQAKARQEFIEALAAAAEESARQRTERRDRLQREKEAEEAREKAEAEQAERDRIAAMTRYCFGAVGEDCGKFNASPYASWNRGIGIDFDIQKSTCLPDGRGHGCWVNSGSWLHDECCYDSPNGYVCGGNDTSQDCKDEWDRAWRRTASFFTWTDYFGPQGTVGGEVNQSHCAPNGQLIEKPEDNARDNDYGFDDRELCCSGNQRNLHWWEAGPLYTAHTVMLYFEPAEMCAP